MFFKRKRKQLVAAALAIMLSVGTVVPAFVVNAPLVSAAQSNTAQLDLAGTPSKEQIKRAFTTYRYQDILNSSVTYAETPVVSPVSSLKAGRLSNTTIKDTLDMINLVRFLVGMNEVTENQQYSLYAQSASVYLAHMNAGLTHYPAKVSGVSDAFYKNASELGTKQSNLSAGYTNIVKGIIGQMRDNSGSNLATVGHRRWLVDSELKEVGLGFASASGGSYRYYAAIHVIHGNYNKNLYTKDVAWPAPNMPLELFGNSDPWSVSLSKYYDNVNQANLKITLTNRKTGKKWTEKEMYVSANNDTYAQPKVIIFRPNDISYQDGDIFDVRIEGLSGKASALEYSVEFFQAVAGASTTPTTPTLTPSNNYDVIFNLARGKGYVSATITTDHILTLPDTTHLTLTGYTFNGWKNNDDGKIYQSGQKFLLTKDTTFTAQWKPNTRYSVTFLPNGASGTVPTATVSDQNLVVLPSANSLDRYGYTFKGWKMNDESVLYHVGQFVILNGDTVFTAQWTPNNTSNQLTLDTTSVNLQTGGKYTFLVKDNQDTANLKVETTNPNIASVQLESANNSRGAKYQVTAKAVGTTDVKVTYKGQTAVMKVNVTKPSSSVTTNPGKGSVMLDTANYIMAPGNIYDIGVTIKDKNGNTISGQQAQQLLANGKLTVRDSRTGSIANLTQLPNGNFRVTGKNPGTCYIVYEIGGTHASVKIDVQKGVSQHGTAVRHTSYFTKDVF